MEDSFSVFGRSMDVIRSSELVERAKSMATGLLSLRIATTVDRYNGPVLFEGEAAGEVLADVFAPAIGCCPLPAYRSAAV